MRVRGKVEREFEGEKGMGGRAHPQTQTHTHRHTHTQTDTHKQTHTNRHTQTDTHKQTHTNIEWFCLNPSGYLEGNMVEAPDGTLYNILRFNVRPLVLGNYAIALRYNVKDNALR